MSPSDEMSRRDELESLLPFYVNGTLEGDDLAAVERWLRDDPEAQAALAEAESEFSETLAVNEAIRPPADALSRFSKALDAQAGPVRAASSPSLLASLMGRFMAIPAGVAWAAAAIAIGFILVQSALQPGGRGPDFEVAGSEDGTATMPFALVSFKPDAKMADITAFLADNRATILSGPAAGSIFKVGIPVETIADYDRMLGLIAAQPFTEVVLAGRKPSNG